MSTLHTYNLIVCILRDVESLINVTHNPLDIVCQCYIFFYRRDKTKTDTDPNQNEFMRISSQTKETLYDNYVTYHC